jgi:precorrin-6B methylase 2
VDDLYSLLKRLDSGAVVVDLGCGHGSFRYESCRGRIIAMDVDRSGDQSSGPTSAIFEPILLHFRS